MSNTVRIKCDGVQIERNQDTGDYYALLENPDLSAQKAEAVKGKLEEIKKRINLAYPLAFTEYVNEGQMNLVRGKQAMTAIVRLSREGQEILGFIDSLLAEEEKE